MSRYGLKINKTEKPDKTPYTIYYPHSNIYNNIEHEYLQVLSIDPARKNYALRIERRYGNNKIIPIVFDKTAIEDIIEEDNLTICNTYEKLTNFLDKYENFYKQCHMFIIERQLPQNYKATRIAQHTISYFCLKLKDSKLQPYIFEIDPKLKGKMLGAPKGINDKQIKSWSVEKARSLLIERKDDFSIKILNFFNNKQDDLSDTVCQIEAMFTYWKNVNKIPFKLKNGENKILENKILENKDSENKIPENKILENKTLENNQVVLNILNGLTDKHLPLVVKQNNEKQNNEKQINESQINERNNLRCSTSPKLAVHVLSLPQIKPSKSMDNISNLQNTGKLIKLKIIN